MSGSVFDRKDAGNLGKVLTGSLIRLVLQLIPFVIVARQLGADDFGSFAAVVALCSGLGALVGWGSGNLFVRDHAQQPQNSLRYTGRMVGTTLASSVVVAGLAWGLSVGIFNIGLPTGALLLLITADCFFGRFTYLQSFALLAQGRGTAAAINDVAFAATRAMAAVLFVTLSASGSVETWAVYYLVATMFGGAIALSWTWRDIVAAPFWAISKADLGDGASFAVGSSAHMMRRQIDRPLAELLLAGEASGQYAAAARLAEAAMMPIATFFRVAYRRFFGTQEDASRMRAVLLQFGAILALGSLCVAGALWFVSGHLHLLLGEAYASSGQALQILAVLPILFAMNNLAGDALSGLERQWVRVACELVALTLKIGLLLSLVAPGSTLVWFAGLIIISEAISTLVMVWQSGAALPKSEGARHAK